MTVHRFATRGLCRLPNTICRQSKPCLKLLPLPSGWACRRRIYALLDHGVRFCGLEHFRLAFSIGGGLFHFGLLLDMKYVYFVFLYAVLWKFAAQSILSLGLFTQYTFVASLRFCYSGIFLDGHNCASNLFYEVCASKKSMGMTPQCFKFDSVGHMVVIAFRNFYAASRHFVDHHLRYRHLSKSTTDVDKVRFLMR